MVKTWAYFKLQIDVRKIKEYYRTLEKREKQNLIKCGEKIPEKYGITIREENELGYTTIQIKSQLRSCTTIQELLIALRNVIEDEWNKAMFNNWKLLEVARSIF